MPDEAPREELTLVKPLVAGEDPDSGEVRQLDPQRLRLWRSDTGHLRLEIEGERSVLHVKVARAFPLHDPERYLGLRDAADTDIGMVVNPRELSADSYALVEEELQKRYFVPVITRIYEVKEEFGVGYWDVETDKGRREFIVRGLRDSVREVGEHRLIITDMDNNRFDIPDIDALDPRSYRCIEKVL